jgi:hypothetical protein
MTEKYNKLEIRIMKKAINVFIITEEGRSYNNEGLMCITNVLKEHYNVTDELIFGMGLKYNDPKFLCQELKQNPDSFVAISSAEGIQFIPAPNIPGICQMLTDYPNESSWKLFMKYFEPPKQSDN